MRYLPALSESTLTMILVFALRACTKAPRTAAPSGAVTVPDTVAASAVLIGKAKGANTPRSSRAAERMAFPRACRCGSRIARACRGANGTSRHLAHATFAPPRLRNKHTLTGKHAAF